MLLPLEIGYLCHFPCQNRFFTENVSLHHWLPILCLARMSLMTEVISLHPYYKGDWENTHWTSIVSIQENTRNSRKLFKDTWSLKRLTNICYSLCDLHPNIASVIQLMIYNCVSRKISEVLTPGTWSCNFIQRQNFADVNNVRCSLQCKQCKMKSYWIRVCPRSNMAVSV